MVKLKYTDYANVAILAPGEVATSYFYKMNAPFQPTSASIGTIDIPGLTEYASMYGRYRVVASSCLVKLIPDLTVDANTNAIDAVLTPVVDTVSPTFGPNIVANPNDVKKYMGNPYAKGVFINGSPAGGVWRSANLYQYTTMEKITGSLEPHTSSNFSGTTGQGTITAATNPGTLTFWLIAATTHSYGEVSTGAVAMTVQITYWVEFFQRETELN